AAGVRIAAHVELARPPQRPRQEPPMHEVFGLVDLHAGVPLERGRGDVVIVADAQNRRIGVEAAENWIGHVHGPYRSRSRAAPAEFSRIPLRELTPPPAPVKDA